MTEDKKEMTPEEAMYWADVHTIEHSNSNSRKSATSLGVLPDNYDRYMLEKKGIEYLKTIFKENIDNTFAEIKFDYDLDLFSKILKLNVTDIKEMWEKQKKKHKEENRKEPPKQFSNAVRLFSDKIQLAELFHEKQPIYYDKGGLFWLWNEGNKSWFMVDETDLMNFIHNSSIGVDTIESKERNEIIQALKQVGRIYRPIELPKTWIQFKNGIVDINDSHVLKNVTSEYFTVNPIPWNIGTSADTPVMDRIFEEWVGKDHVKTLYQILAYCLLPDYPLHRIFCFIGAGMNGKSKFLELLRRFIGEENVTATELDTLISSRFEVTRLYKRLICQMGETNFSELNKTSVLKKLSGGDMIGFEYKNKTPFESINYAKILISTNNLPTTSDKTIGFYRRWLIIDFPNQFSEKKEILSDIPEVEYENLAFKCIGILRELMQVKEFHNEGSIEDRMKKYEDHSDPLEKFIKEFTTDDPDGYVWKFEFEKKLNEWCKENRHRQISEVVIGKKMKEKGIMQQQRQSEWLIEGYRKMLRCWTGISWGDKVRVNSPNSQDKQDKQVIPTQFSCISNELNLPVKVVNPVNGKIEVTYQT